MEKPVGKQGVGVSGNYKKTPALRIGYAGSFEA
jgi:hypothetical protein